VGSSLNLLGEVAELARSEGDAMPVHSGQDPLWPSFLGTCGLETFQVEGIVDGLGVIEPLFDQIESTLKVVADVVVVYAEDEESVIVEPSVACSIAVEIVMGLTVEFDNQHLGKAHEVSDVGANRLLPTEADAKLTPSQLLPQKMFEPGWILSHLSCEPQKAFVSTSHASFVSEPRLKVKSPVG
jgi:hypothetical protein